jgi:hypothetical protein
VNQFPLSTLENSSKSLTALFKNKWIDRYSSLIYIQFVVQRIDSLQLIVTSLLIENPDGVNLLHYSDIDVINLPVHPEIKITLDFMMILLHIILIV